MSILTVGPNSAPAQAGVGVRGPPQLRRWYGISGDTIDRGLRELDRLGLVSRRFLTVENWSSPTGEITEIRYRLKTPFARPKRVPTSKGHLAVVGE